MDMDTAFGEAIVDIVTHNITGKAETKSEILKYKTESSRLPASLLSLLLRNSFFYSETHSI